MPFFRRVEDDVYEMNDPLVDLVEIARIHGPMMVLMGTMSKSSWVGMSLQQDFCVCYVGSEN